MSMKVLRQKLSIATARETLNRMGASAIETRVDHALRRLRLKRGVKLGDEIKSWDVLETIQFIRSHCPTDAPILDIGCYASEIVVSLHKLGYTRLSGADLNPAIQEMPFASSIRYVQTDFKSTPFEDRSFQAVTAISVIEHGFESTNLLREISRLLKPGGFFIASFDYWPDKIDTSGIKFFGLDWLIFSKADVGSFIREADAFGLSPVGDLEFEAMESPIECGGKSYTFAWLALTKRLES